MKNKEKIDSTYYVQDTTRMQRIYSGIIFLFIESGILLY